MRNIVALLTCCAMVYHYTVGDCFHAHCHAPEAVAASAEVHDHQHDRCAGHQHDDEELAADHGPTDSQESPSCPHDDFHDGHSTATLTASSPYSHWGAAKAPVAVLDGAIVVACEQLGSSETFRADLAHDYRIRTRGDCYRGLGAFLS